MEGQGTAQRHKRTHTHSHAAAEPAFSLQGKRATRILTCHNVATGAQFQHTRPGVEQNSTCPGTSQ
jgi:hypothetical protein